MNRAATFSFFENDPKAKQNEETLIGGEWIFFIFA